jgi:predicted GNAT family acetyltransferase
MDQIIHEQNSKGGGFYYELDGKRLGEMTYILAGESKLIIDNTEVDDSLKGQGVGKRILGQLVEYVRQHHIKVVPLCPFAKATLQRTPEWQDILDHPFTA